MPTVIDLILSRLGAGHAGRMAAGHKGDMGGYAFFGSDPKTGRRFLCQTIMGGGWGGRADEDGENATVSMCQGDVQNAPVELQEIYYPVLVEHQSLREGSGGAGKFRGGLGIEVSPCACSATHTPMSISNASAPRRGGCSTVKYGATAKALVKQTPGDSGHMADQETQLSFEGKGGSVTFFTAGGGGYGASRSVLVKLIERDRRLGYVSGREYHRGDYGRDARIREAVTVRVRAGDAR